MKSTLNVATREGMYMDIQSIEFECDRVKFKEQVDKSLKIIEENKLISSVEIKTFNNKAVYSTRFFNSTKEDKNKTEECDSKIDVETISISPSGVWYRGYNKWTSDFLETNLESLLKENT